MKKVLVIALAGLMVLALAACDEVDVLRSVLNDDAMLATIADELDADERAEVLELVNQIAAKVDAYEVSGSSGAAVQGGSSTAGSSGAASAADSAASLSISLAQAKEIALEKAGLSAADVSFTKEKLENNNRVYDIEFYSNGREYDFEISASTGEILEYSTEGGALSSAGSGSYIGVEDAKEIALVDAGVSASDAVFSKAKEDRDDGRTVYEIKFRAGRYTYEYEIDASTGAILESDRD